MRALPSKPSLFFSLTRSRLTAPCLVAAALALGCGGGSVTEISSSCTGASAGGSTTGGTGGTGGAPTTMSTTDTSPTTSTPTILPGGAWWKHLEAPEPGDSWMVVPGAMTVDAHGHVLITGRANSMIDFESPAGTTGPVPRCLFIAKYDVDGTLLWAKQFGASGAYSKVTGITTDADDSIVLTGQYQGGPVSFGGSDLAKSKTTSLFVARLDAGGDHVWSLARGGTSSWDTGGGVAIDPQGRVVAAGVVDSHMTVLWISKAGDVVLEKATPGVVWINESFLSPVAGVAVDGAGNAVVAGTFTASGVDFGAGPTPGSPFEAGFAASFSGVDGALRWVKTFPTTGGEGVTGTGVFMKGIARTPGGVVIAGNTMDDIDLGPGVGTVTGAYFSGFVASLSAEDGATQWGAAITSVSSVSGVTRAPGGGAALTAVWQGTAKLGATPLDGDGLHLLTLGEKGELLASRPFAELGKAPATAEEMQPIAVDSSGQLALAFGFLNDLDMPLASVPKGSKSLEDLFLVHLSP